MRLGIERSVVALAAAALLAGSVQAAAQDHEPAPTWKRALWIRSEGLNRAYGLGDFAPSWQRALRVRSEGLNRR